MKGYGRQSFSAAIGVLVCMIGIAGCAQGPLAVRAMDAAEIQAVSNYRLCDASLVFQQTRSQRYPTIENEIARRGLACGGNTVQTAQADFATEATDMTATPEPTVSHVLTNVNMRSGPGTDHRSLRVLSAGETVTIRRVLGNWCECSAANGVVGYVRCDFLQPPLGGWMVVASGGGAQITSGGAIAESTLSPDSVARRRELVAFCATNRNHEGLLEGSGLRIDQQWHAWRCENGVVMVCFVGASGRTCLRTRPVDPRYMQGFVGFCREHPGSSIPMALSGGLDSHWTCSGTQPVVSEMLEVDPNGYLQGAWEPLPGSNSTSPPATNADGLDASVRAFVTSVYSLYDNDGEGWRERQESVFAPELAAALREHSRLEGARGEAWLDYDPLCQCQDPVGLRETIRSINRQSDTRATVAIDLLLPTGPGSSNRESVQLQLLMTPNGWRIEDVLETGQPNLLGRLNAQISQMRNR